MTDATAGSIMLSMTNQMTTRPMFAATLFGNVYGLGDTPEAARTDAAQWGDDESAFVVFPVSASTVDAINAGAIRLPGSVAL